MLGINNMLGLLTFVFLALAHCCAFSNSKSSSAALSVTGNVDFLPIDLFNLSWAMYTPWFPVAAYIAPPKDCEVTQVHLLERHGARFPTSGAGKRIQTALTKLQSASEIKDPRLEFLKNYIFDLGTADLITFGAMQAQASADTLARRYPRLAKHKPFIRASGGQRVIDTATNWTAGWHTATGSHAKLNVIIAEDGVNSNNTLQDAMCPNVGESGPQTELWQSTFFPPLTASLNAAAPGAILTDADTYNLMSMCPFDALAKEKMSPFCALFTAEDFAGFEYVGDLDKYYGSGYGQELGRIQGVGYVNELLARLTKTPVSDNTQTNRTLDSDKHTFPLDEKIYADFSHDNQMIAIYAALGLFNFSSEEGGKGGGLADGGLDPTKMNPERGWRVNQLVPFSAKMVVERMECSKSHGSSTALVSSRSSKKFVRILVNDALQPLQFCGAGADGLCALNDFVESQSYARANGEGDFEKCFN